MKRSLLLAVGILAGILLLPSIVQAKQLNAYDQMLSDYEYPYPVSNYEFRDQGKALRMAYMDIKPANMAEGAPVVVLFHGKNFNSAYWEATAEALVQQGFRVIACDQIGFGKSSKPERYQFSFHTLAKNTRGLLLSLGIKRVSLIGHSMGGMVATRFALMYPDAVERMVLVNPIGLEDYKRVVPYRAVDVWVEKEQEQKPEDVIEYQKNNYYHGTWTEEYERWAEPIMSWLRGPDKSRLAWISALTYDMIYTQPVIYEFSKLKMPVLLILGDQDRAAIGKDQVPEEIQKNLGQYKRLGPRAVKLLSKGKLIMLKGVGHCPHIEDFFHFIDPTLRFLGQGRR